MGELVAAQASGHINPSTFVAGMLRFEARTAVPHGLTLSASDLVVRVKRGLDLSTYPSGEIGRAS